MSLVEQERLTVREQLNLPPVVRGVRVARFLVFCVVLCRYSVFLLSFFLLAIVLSVLLFTASDYFIFQTFLVLREFKIVATVAKKNILILALSGDLILYIKKSVKKI